MASDQSSNAAITATAPTSEDLWLAFQRGNSAALAALIERYERRLARIAYRIVGCVGEAEDVRHSVFVRLLSSMGASPPIQNVGAWLTRCVVNEALARVRQRDRESRIKAEFARSGNRAVEATPLDQMQDRESHDRLAVALTALSPDERSLVALRFDESLTFREIARILERPASTIKSRNL